jgi:hypothetical protein
MRSFLAKIAATLAAVAFAAALPTAFHVPFKPSSVRLPLAVPS